MSVRKNCARFGAAAAAVSGLVFTALAPANADTVPSGGVTLGTTIIGVGSDTTQWVMDKLTEDYNATNPAVTMANYDACLGNTTAGAPGLGDNPDGSGFPCGADHSGTKAGVKRDEGVVDPAAAGGTLPSGSGDGRTLLRSPSDKLFNDVAFGRSSGPINTDDLAAGESALPFAVDKIVVATNPTGPAPAALTGDQVLKIFNGTFTNWNQVGGRNAPIHPYMPKSGSSTLNAFMSFLAALDGVNEAPGKDNDPASHAAAHQSWQGPGNVTNANWDQGTVNVEEHDPSAIANDPNAIEPFSYGRAQLANGGAQTVRIEGGWSADRELYNVVRTKDIANASTTPFKYGADSNVLENIFSSTGWICTDATAQGDIADAGFWPLQSGDTTGRCGVPNNNTEDTINPSGSAGVDEGAATTTSAYYAGGAVHVSVSAKDGSTPTGKVQVVVAAMGLIGQPAPAAAFHTTVSLTNGAATVPVPASAGGPKVVDVAYLSTGFGAKASAGGHTALGVSDTEFNANIAGRVGTTMSVTAPHKTTGTKTATVKVVVRPKSGTAKPTGKIVIKLGSKVIAKKSLTNGVAKIRIKGKKLRKGVNKLKVTYLATGFFIGGEHKTIKIKRTR